MRINQINSVNTLRTNKPYKINNNNDFRAVSNAKFVTPSLENLQACFLPSFKAFEPVKEVVVFDRETNQPHKAVVLKDDVGDFSSFELYIDGKTAGFMHFKNEKDFCEIRHLRTLDAGKKYSGIGTALVGCAIDESFLYGKNGCVFAMSQKGYGKDFSDYNKGTNPLPFYLKRGFVISDIKIDDNLNSLNKQDDNDEYPNKVMVVLTSEAAREFREKYDKDSVYLED